MTAECKIQKVIHDPFSKSTAKCHPSPTSSLRLFWLEPDKSRHKEANRRAPMSGLILQKLESINDVTWDRSYLVPKGLKG